MKRLMEILENLSMELFHCDSRKPDVRQRPISQAHDQIIGLFRECLPEKYHKEDISEQSSLTDERKIWIKGFNQAITQAQKNMEG